MAFFKNENKFLASDTDKARFYCRAQPTTSSGRLSVLSLGVHRMPPPARSAQAAAGPRPGPGMDRDAGEGAAPRRMRTGGGKALPRGSDSGRRQGTGQSPPWGGRAGGSGAEQMLQVKARGTGAPREVTELTEGTEGRDRAGGRREPEKMRRVHSRGQVCTC